MPEPREEAPQAAPGAPTTADPVAPGGSAAGPKCRACIEQGIPGECTDPAHQVAPEIGVSRSGRHPRTGSAPQAGVLRDGAPGVTMPPVRELLGIADDEHPREDAVRVIATALDRLGCGRPVDPYDPEDCASVAVEAVWALIRAGMLPAAPDAPEPPADLREAIDSIRRDLGHTRETIAPVVVEHSPRGSYVVGSAEPPTDLRDAIARAAGLAIAQCHDDGPLTWHPCGQCQGTPCACSGEPFSVVVADAVLPIVQAHVAAVRQQAWTEGGRAGAVEASRAAALDAEATWQRFVRQLRSRADQIAAGGEQRG